MTALETACQTMETAYLECCKALGQVCIEHHKAQRPGLDLKPVEALADLWSGQLNAQRARGLRPIADPPGFLCEARVVPLVAGNPDLGPVNVENAGEV